MINVPRKSEAETHHGPVPEPSEQLFDGDPIPLRRRNTNCSFPVDALPTTYAEMINAVAEATQTDPAMPGVTVLAVLAAAAGGCVEVEVRPGWREPTNMFYVTIALPGERKSAVQSILTAPIVEAEEELAEATKGQRREAEVLRQIAQAKAKTMRERAARPKKNEDETALTAEASSLAAYADEVEVPPVTRLIADDATPEAAATLLAEQKRLAIISAEGGVFDILAGRYSNNIPNLDLWLKGHAGDTIRIDRKGRDPEYVKRPALTVGLMVQPAVLDSIGRVGQFRGRGLLDRFMFAQPTSHVGYRKSNAEPVPEEVADAYTTALHRLVTQLHGWVGGPVALTLTPEAHAAVVELLDATEIELRPNGNLGGAVRGWGSKYVGAVIRIAGLLHLAEHGETGVRSPVEADTITAAARLGTYFKANAVQAYATMTTDETTADAIYLLDRIMRMVEAGGGNREFSQRDIYNDTRGRFKKVPDLLPALGHLVDHGYLVKLPDPEARGPGRRPSPRYLVHPSVAADSAHSA